MSVAFKAPINPEVLRWARESLAIDLEKASKGVAVPIEEYKKWESGDELPPISKVQKLADIYKRPLAAFFMPVVPETPPLPKDFRRIHPEDDEKLSTESLLIIRKALWNQTIAKELMNEIGYPVRPIRKKKIKLGDNVEKTVEKIRKTEVDIQLSWTDNWEALKRWREYLEDEEEIFVFQYPMPKEEIRGFSLIRKDYPPVIVINSKDTPNGRIFTLFHEFAHYLLNQDGICSPDESDIGNQNMFEKYCDEFAANFLVPRKSLETIMSERNFSDIFEQIAFLSKKFKVSSFVILRRFYELKIVKLKEYHNIYQILLSKIRKTGSSGGNFYKNKFAEKGRKFISLVVEAESGNSIPTSRALEMLGIQLKQYNKIIEMLYEREL